MFTAQNKVSTIFVLNVYRPKHKVSTIFVLNVYRPKQGKYDICVECLPPIINVTVILLYPCTLLESSLLIMSRYCLCWLCHAIVFVGYVTLFCLLVMSRYCLCWLCHAIVFVGYVTLFCLLVMSRYCQPQCNVIFNSNVCVRAWVRACLGTCVRACVRIIVVWPLTKCGRPVPIHVRPNLGQIITEIYNAYIRGLISS